MDTDMVLDFNEESEFIAKRTGCSIEEADAYIDGAFDYEVAHGFIIGDEPLTPEQEEESKRKVPTEYLDMDDRAAYIGRVKGLSAELLERIMDAEMEYEMELGLTGPEFDYDEDNE